MTLPKHPRARMRADGIPTRCDVQWMTPAELAISAAMRAVEGAGASEHLTAAVLLLGQARDRAADHAEGLPAPSSPPAAPTWLDLARVMARTCYGVDRVDDVIEAADAVVSLLRSRGVVVDVGNRVPTLAEKSR